MQPLHDIQSARKYPHIPVYSEHDAAFLTGHLLDVWIENKIPLGLWKLETSDTHYIIYIWERGWATTIDDLISLGPGVNRDWVIDRKYHTLNADRTPVRKSNRI